MSDIARVAGATAHMNSPKGKHKAVEHPERDRRGVDISAAQHHEAKSGCHAKVNKKK